jgi:hypothetical protein
VTAIPEGLLRLERTIEHPSLPFKLWSEFFPELAIADAKRIDDGARPIANQGPGAQIAVQFAPRATGVDERDVVTAAIEIMPIDFAGAAAPALGTWLSGCTRRAAEIFLRRSHPGSWSCGRRATTNRSA